MVICLPLTVIVPAVTAVAKPASLKTSPLTSSVELKAAGRRKRQFILRLRRVA